MMRAAILPACAVIALGCGHRQQGNAWAHYELTAWHDVDSPAAAPPAMPGPAPQFSELILGGVRLHGLIGHARWGYHAGLDLAAGSTLRGGGLAYDVALLPIGAGIRLGATSAIMLGAGIGAMGAVGTIDDAVTLPLELTGEFGGGRIRVVTRVRISYVAGAAERARGAPTLSFADEAEAMLGIRIGHHHDPGGFPTGNGYFAGVACRELLGARFAGLVIGYSIDLATEPRRAVAPD
jgi:hypothetical protein